VIEAGGTPVIRSVYTAVQTGEFLGTPATGRNVTYDAMDMVRITDGRIAWGFLLCDGKGVMDQLAAGA
jgi:predicted ester cyclase